ncbi:permease of the major facilitator superfamily [Aeropyrum camini SY1 = JCM 12091]|uniref:Permease of the major facilitator superfamily n=2 Tax=Aeropyrum camini TaxID=229980 RepID=U3TC00_9CREN|nr:permease of the major facilitator superfamily [Aeropyrum camini SY1 = JCM 12091]
MRLFKILLGVLVMVVAVDSLRGRMIASKISRILSRRVAKISGVKPSLFAYGFLYNIVGGGCAIPIIIGLLASSLPLGPINTAFIITIFTITMAVLLAVHVLVPNRITVSVGTRYWPKIVMATYTLQALAGLAILLSGVYPALFMTFI